MKLKFFKSLLAATLMTGVAGLTLGVNGADAARIGGGKSVGKQSQNVTKKEAPAQAAKPAAQPAAPAQPPAAPAPARNKWLGPLAGLAAGLGIAALLSHLGMGGAMGEMLGSFLMIAGLALAAMFVWRMWRARQNPQQPALAGAGAPFDGAAREQLRQEPTGPVSLGGAAGGAAASQALAAPAATGTWTLPAGFDTDDFLHIAKMYFVRLQAAWDRKDEADIRDFTSPEMFAEIKLDLVARGDAPNQTDVVTLNAEFLGVEELGERTMASVRLSGMLREEAGAEAKPFTEVWNLTKPATARASWVLAGIQQE